MVTMISMDVGRFVNFEEFITPKVMSIIYLLGVIVIILVSLAAIAMSFKTGSSSFYYQSEPSIDWMMIVAGILYFIFGNLIWRMICEFVVVIFKIHDSIESVDNHVISLKPPQ